MRESEREGERETVCVFEREKTGERKTEREKERERERECECERDMEGERHTERNYHAHHGLEEEQAASLNQQTECACVRERE